jgi:ATP-binding cassette subfamily C (CFTR/MRP) protein 4
MLKMSNIDHETTGQLINMVSNDAARIESSVYLISYILIAPLEALSVIFLLIYLIDLTVLSGLTLLVLALPLQAILGKVLNRIRVIACKKSDKRINMLNELFSFIKIIKMYCWQDFFKKSIQEQRK